MSAPSFPFTAVVGLDTLGLGLCLSAVSPGIGGVLVRGEKGTAKTTMVRGLAAVLPEVDVVDGCRFACRPEAVDPTCPDWARHAATVTRRPATLVELPVGASEDRVVGALHLDSLLGSGQVAFEPGLLAAAHRGILYVDEVNLLPDHLVDTLLDSAATGRARVEREGVSVSHAAAFVLVGTMNPEEGDLRPQLLDRFGLTVAVAASRDPGTRVEVMRRRLAFERDPLGFTRGYATREGDLARRMVAARARLPEVRVGDAQMLAIATICALYDVDGLRGDLVTARAAAAHAAWHDRESVTAQDIRVAARLALPHRRRRDPFDTPESAQADLERILAEVLGDEPPEPPDDAGDAPPTDPPDEPVDDGSAPDPPPKDAAEDDTPPQRAGETTEGGEAGAPDRGRHDPTSSSGEPDQPNDTDDPDASESAAGPRPRRASAGPAYDTRLFTVDRVGAGVAGRRSRAVTSIGRHVRAVIPTDPRGRGLAASATLRAAAAAQPARGRAPGEPLRLRGRDLRRGVREGKEGNLVVFAVDVSGSMGARRRMGEVKTAVLSLLVDAYRRRDKVAVVAFGGAGARVLLPPTGSVELARARLEEVRTGGRTPLAEGLLVAGALVRRERAKDPQRRPLLVVLTDGRATSGPDALTRSRAAARHVAGQGTDRAPTCVVVDCETGRGVRLGLARELAAALDAGYVALDGVAASASSVLVGVAEAARPGRAQAPAPRHDHRHDHRRGDPAATGR